MALATLIIGGLGEPGVPPVLLRRFDTAQTRDAEGYPIQPAFTDTAIAASVQPAQGEDLEFLPEGVRVRDSRRLYTEVEVREADVSTKSKADWIVYKGAQYKVVNVRVYDAVIPHYRAIMIKLQEN